jgi:hypothetical protein
MTNIFKLKDECDEKSQQYQKKYNLKTNPIQEFKGADDEQDAFRHAFASAHFILTGLPAKVLGNAWENFGPGSSVNNPGSKNMDLWNNAVGREIGSEILKEFGNTKNIAPETLDDMIAEKIIQKMKSGELITNPKDRRDFESSHHNGRIYTREDIGNMSTDEFRRNEKAINKQMKEKGVPSNADATEKVKSDGMIWVGTYTRADGTEVKGYYM